MKRVLVCMSTYNGEKYIEQQIHSILHQDNVEVTIKIRDDGSQDQTLDIVRKYADEYSNIKYIQGENIGYRKSFFTLLTSESEKYDYYAFSDQDDVWNSNKLYKAVIALEKESAKYKMYASALCVVDENLNFMYNNTFPKLRISLGSALSRQRLAGCTMVFNHNLKEVCCRFNMERDKHNFLAHDMIVYLVCNMLGGCVIYDSGSEINYRRHKGTVTEHGKGLAERIKSVLKIFTYDRNKRFDSIKIFYDIYEDMLCPSARKLMNQIVSYRDSVKNTIILAFDKEIRSGLISVDVVNFFAILLRRY